MKKLFRILLFFVLFIPICLGAVYVKDYKETYTQPNGIKVVVYTTGDEYYRYTHTKDGYVLTIDKDGYMVYAYLKDGVVTPGSVKAQDKVPSNAIKNSDINKDKNSNLIHKINEPELNGKFKAKSNIYYQNGQVLHFKNIIVFIRFKGSSEYVNDTFVNTTKDIYGINSYVGSVKDYVRNVSNGKVSLDNSLLQYDGNTYYSYEDSHTRGYYMAYNTSNSVGYSADDEDEGYKRLHTMFGNALSAMPETTKENVDGNNDGAIDNIIFVVEGEKAGWSDVLWPHKWTMTAEGMQTTYSGATTGTYNLQFQNDMTKDDVSVFTHEMMHSLGIADYYRYRDDYNGDPVGAWDMMNRNRPYTYVNSYVRYNSGKAISGEHWVKPIATITDAGKYIINAAATSDENISYLIKTSNTKEYVQVEYRLQNSGENNIYDKNVYGSGLVVSRINQACYGNQGYKINGSNVNAVNVCDEYYIYRDGDIYSKGNKGGGFGDISTGYITPCTGLDCTNIKGDRLTYSSSTNAGMDAGVFVLSNNTNSQVVIRNVRQHTPTQLSFEVFPTNDVAYLEEKEYQGIPGSTHQINVVKIDSTVTTTYSTSNSSVATVNASGLVTLVEVGECTINVTTGSSTDYFKVYSVPYISNLSVSAQAINKVKLTYEKNDSASKYILYRSTDNDNFTKIGETTDNYFIDTSAINGKYYYRLGYVIDGVEYNDISVASANTSDFLPKKVTNLNVSFINPSKISLTYNIDENATHYKIERLDNNTNETITEFVTGTSFTDEDLVFGRAYLYNVTGCTLYQEYYYCGEKSNNVDANTKSFLLEFTNNINITKVDIDSIKISFNSLAGADNYDIYRSKDNKTFTKIAENITDTEYVDNDLLAGSTYYYKVSANKVSEGNTYRGYISNAKSFTLGLNIPSLDLINKNYNSITINMSGEEGITGYQLYYSTSANGKYTLLTTTSSNTYNHTKLTFNKKYYYKVRSYIKNSNGTIYSGYSDIYNLNANMEGPTLNVFTNGNIVTINITKVANASKYKIYKDNVLLTTTTALTYQFNINDNNAHIIKVTPLTSKNVVGTSTGIEYDNSDKLEKINNLTVDKVDDNKLKFTFDKLDGIDNYAILRSTSLNGTYTKVAQSSENEINYNLTSYSKYYYKVASVNVINNVTYYSNMSDAISYTLTENKLKAYINVLTNDSINIVWSSVKNATKYNVYKVVDETDILLKSVKTTSYKLTALTEENYTFKVIAYDKKNMVLDTNILYYDYDIEIPDSVVIDSITSVDNKTVKVVLNPVSESDQYEIYYSTNNKSYTKVKTTTELENNITVNANTKYYFKVKAVNKNGKLVSYSALSSYKTYTLGVMAPSNLVLTSKGGNSVNISYDDVNGSKGYEIYYSTKSSSGFKKISTTKNSYTQTKLIVGTKYYYKVRSYVKVGSKTYYSSYVTGNVVVVPEVTSVNTTPINKNTIRVEWTKVTGANNYKLYIKENDAYRFVGETTSLKYDVTNLEMNKDYQFKLVPYYKTTAGIEKEFNQKMIIMPVNSINAVSTNDATKVQLTFDNIYNGVEIFLEDNLIVDTHLAYYNDAGLTINKDYKYSFRNYAVIGGEKVYSEKVDYVYTPKLYEAYDIEMMDDYNIINIGYNLNEYVDGVEVYRSTNKDSGFVKIGDNVNVIDAATSPINTTYYYKFRTYKTINGIKYYSDGVVVPYTVKLHKVNNFSGVSTSYNSIKLTFDKDSHAAGYEIYYSTSANGKYTLLKKTTANSYTHSKLSFNKTYYYKVRSYGTYNGKTIYSDYTDVIAVKTVLSNPTIKSITRYNYKSTQNKITYSAVSNASGYQIYRSNDNSNFVLAGTTTSTSFIDKNATKGSINYYKVRAYKTVSGKKVYGGYSDVLSIAAPLKPDISIFSASTGKSASLFLLLVSNKGSKPLKIINSNAQLIDRDYSSFDRKLSLINTDNFNSIASQTISAGNSQAVWFKCNPSSWWDKYSRIMFMFEYDGVRYMASYSEYYTSGYYEY